MTIPTYPNPLNLGFSRSIKWANPIPLHCPNPTSKKNNGIAKVKTKRK